VVQARIMDGDRMMFASDKYHPVLTGGYGSEVTMLLRRVGSQNEPPDEPLTNTYWKLAMLGGAPVTPAPNQREAHFILQLAGNRVVGSGGCNRFTGGYETDGEKLTIGRLASTMMACAQGMDTEQKFLAALQQAARAKISGQRMELLDVSGKVLANFQAVHFR